MRTWDAIVVGGGPAGAAAARAASKAGLDTLLLEAEEFPRPKPCAGGVTAAALAELGEPLPPGVAGRACLAVRPRYGSLSVTVRRPDVIAEVVRREELDAHLVALARRSGAEIRHGVKVNAAEPDESGVTLYTTRGEHRARVVIGADGAGSKVARVVRPPFRRADLGVCLVAELPSGLIEARDPFFADGLEVWYDQRIQGYGWIFPQAGGLNVGIGSLARRLPLPRRFLSSFLALAGLPEPTRVTGAVLPLGGPARTVQLGRVMLAGDAAGVADPFTGEGIRYALISGRIAGECAASALRRSLAAPDLSAYAARCRQAFAGDLWYAFWFAHLYLALPPAVNALVFRHPGLFARVADILQGKGTYRGLVGELGRRIPAYWLRGLVHGRRNARAGASVPER